MFLLEGILENESRLRVIISHNMETKENANIDTSDGVLVESKLEVENPKKGKAYIPYVNPQTKEQWYEEFDRPLTQEEQLEVQNEKIDLLLQMQMANQGII